MTSTLSIILTILNIAMLYFVIRAYRVQEFRQKWLLVLSDSGEALELYHKFMPSFWKMLLHWKPLRDKHWIPAQIRASKYTVALSPDDRKKLIAFINRSPERYPPGTATEAWKDAIRKMDEKQGE